MSIELADERYLDGKGVGLLGQFASNKGYSDLLAAAKTPALRRFFKTGATEDVKKVKSELRALSLTAPKDVAETALALEKLLGNLKFAMIARGE